MSSALERALSVTLPTSEAVFPSFNYTNAQYLQAVDQTNRLVLQAAYGVTDRGPEIRSEVRLTALGDDTKSIVTRGAARIFKGVGIHRIPALRQKDLAYLGIEPNADLTEYLENIGAGNAYATTVTSYKNNRTAAQTIGLPQETAMLSRHLTKTGRTPSGLYLGSILLLSVTASTTPPAL